MSIVLVLDANQRSALAVIRSLGSIEHVTLLAADSTTTAIGGSSKYCALYLTSPSPTEAPIAFLEWLKQCIDKHRINYVFPVTEVCSQLLLMHQDVLGDSQLPFADYDTVMSLATKDRLVALAQSIGVAVPESHRYANAESLHPEDIVTFPVVVKPTLSRIWLGDRWMNTSVQIAQDQAGLSTILKNCAWLHDHPFMLQAFIPGYGAGLFALYNHGQPVAFFSHKRIREKPPQGGVSVLSESVAIDPQLYESAKKLLDAVSWHGVAMVEYRVANDGTPYLMEVNTRFWGSLQLAIDAGVDFPRLLYQITCSEPISPVENYTVGTRLRWFLGDFDSLYLYLKSAAFTPSQKLKRALRFLTPDFRRTRHEVNRLSDFKPALTEMKQYVKDIIG